MRKPPHAGRYPSAARPRQAEALELEPEASLLDLVDNVLTRGVVVSGDVILGIADIDLVYLRLSALLCAADRVLPNADRRKRRRS